MERSRGALSSVSLTDGFPVREKPMKDASGLWLVTDVAAVLLLGAAMAYGVHMWRTRPRNLALERMSDDATRRLYRSSAREGD